MLSIRDIQKYVQANKYLYNVWRIMNKTISDKIVFDSKYSDETYFTSCKNLKQIKINNFDLEKNYRYNEFIECCAKQKNLEKIEMLNLFNIYSSPLKDLKNNIFQNLTDINLSLILSTKEKDYIAPLLNNATKLEKLRYENGHLSENSMVLLAHKIQLKSLTLINVEIKDEVAFNIFFRKATKLETLEIHYTNFNNLVNKIRIIETIFSFLEDLTLKKIKLFAKEIIYIRNRYKRILYREELTTFKIPKGHFKSFLCALLPLIQADIIYNFEINYSNLHFPNEEHENGLMKYEMDRIAYRQMHVYTYHT